MNRASMLGAWARKYRRRKAEPYGNEAGYRVACSHLSGLPLVEDWGCGRAWARRYFGPETTYIGIDGTAGFADVVQELHKRDSRPDGILMRHVLEHNRDWSRVLENALRCFQARMSLALFTELADELIVTDARLAWNPDIITQRLPRSELLEMLAPYEPVEVREGPETIFFLSKAGGR